VLAKAAVVTIVADRESDIYAEWATLPGGNVHLLTRVMYDRAVAGGGTEADVLAFLTFPKDHRPKIHSTNPLERINGEIKRRTESLPSGLTRGSSAERGASNHAPPVTPGATRRATGRAQAVTPGATRRVAGRGPSKRCRRARDGTDRPRLLHSNALAPRPPILLAARAHSLTFVVYWVPFPRAFGARRG
jgi:hypothetical protein